MSKRTQGKMPSYDGIRAAQAAATFLRLSGGRLDRLKLTKLLYNLDREALRRWRRTVTFDVYYSMQRGQIGSASLDRIRGQVADAHWTRFIKTDGNNIEAITDCPYDELSRAERSLIIELHEKYKDKTGLDMANEHRAHFKEYVRLSSGRQHTSHDKLLRVLGYSEGQIDEFFRDMRLLDVLESAA